MIGLTKVVADRAKKKHTKSTFNLLRRIGFVIYYRMTEDTKKIPERKEKKKRGTEYIERCI